jgi:hypothetical protein
MSDATRTWPDLAEGLYERLTGRGATISYDFADFVVEVPDRTGADSPRATWRLNGRLDISTTEARS